MLQRRYLFALLIGTQIAVAHPCANADTSDPLTLSAYLDASFAHDFNDLPTRKRSYTTQALYSDEPMLNLGFVDATFSSQGYRGRLAVQYGSSVIENYQNEPQTLFRYLQEAFIGVKLSDRLTFDTGIFLSHIGTETWIGRDNATVTRSLIADYSPYYQSGGRLVYQVTPELHTELHFLRGWQNISAPADPAVGTLVSYAPTASLTVQDSTFVGDVSGIRAFNDLGVIVTLSNSFTLTGTYDIGLQERRDDTTALWHGWALIPRYQVSDAVALAFRVEYYSDPSGVIVESLSASSFNATGLSLTVDYALTPELVWRNEYRSLLSSHDVFPRRDGYASSDGVVVTSLVYSVH
jgi:hypothetical protein